MTSVGLTAKYSITVVLQGPGGAAVLDNASSRQKKLWRREIFFVLDDYEAAVD